jgi:alkylated DNA repair dioxygenase AlkB
MSNVRSFPDRDGREPHPPSWRPTLFEVGEPEPDLSFAACRRRLLPPDAWVDHAPGWLAGSAELFDRVHQAMGWSSRTVPMYGDLIDQPRLTATWRGADSDPETGPVIDTVRRVLSHHYDFAFRSAGFNLYRDGDDSVAWHGDRIARDRVHAVVAIVSLGEPRPFKLRPAGGGPSIGFALGSGDLLVMGGSCQRTWQHSVPKVRRAGPRISITFRHELRGSGDQRAASRADQPASTTPIGHDTPVPP